MRARDNCRAQLCDKVRSWSQRLKVEARIIRVQRMTRKWGSCSTTGIITLAEDLIEQEPGFQDFVIAHELLHLLVPTHGRLFKALMTVHVPGWRKFDLSRQRERRLPTIAVPPTRNFETSQIEKKHTDRRVARSAA